MDRDEVVMVPRRYGMSAWFPGAAQLFRDWRRGYTDADMRSGAEKVLASRAPGAFVELTDREWRALFGTDWGRSGDVGCLRAIVAGKDR